MSFTKEQLTGLYNWGPEQDTSLYQGLPSRRTFDRYNGHQVFFIINCILEKTGDLSTKRGREIESMIINRLPFASASELTVFTWLEKEMITV